MKPKPLLPILLLAFSLSAIAQPRIAVLNFNAGVGVQQSDVDGLSAIFNTFFTPQGYTIVERTRVSRILEEYQIQGSNLTETDMARLGELLNVPVIVIGDVNLAMGQYNIDVRAVNVETGAIIAKDGDEWAQGSSYRGTMRTIAERLAKNIPLIDFAPKPVDPTPEVATQPVADDQDRPVVYVPPASAPANPRRYYPEGGSLRFTAGLAILSIAYNHQVTSSFMIGGGVGISNVREVNNWDGGHKTITQGGRGVPVFVEAEVRTPRYGWSLFLNAKIGCLIHNYVTSSRIYVWNYGNWVTYTYPHFFAQAIGGVSYKHLNLGIGWSYNPFGPSPITINLSYNLPLALKKWFF